MMRVFWVADAALFLELQVYLSSFLNAILHYMFLKTSCNMESLFSFL